MDDKLFTEEEMNLFSGNEKSGEASKVVRFKPYEIGENYLFPHTTDEYMKIASI